MYKVIVFLLNQGSIYRKILPPWGGGGRISADDIWGEKYEKGEKKRRNVTEKGKREKRKGKIEKMQSKRVKEMQNREE
jgi:hypothetical protein